MKHIHFIGICGVAMSALALAFKREGHTVTGSDAGFYPPVSTHLKDAGIDFYPGWHPEKMGTPDLVIVGNVASSNNPEWLAVQEKNLPYKSYPEVIRDFFIKPNSIVCAGTYGKTTTATLLSWILTSCGYHPSYMFGGLAEGDFPAASLANSNWSIVEGDEYKASRWDNSPKFAYYAPTHLLLTSIIWDHADVYPTEASYLEAFQKLVDGLPHNGLIVISDKVVAKIKFKAEQNLKIVTYGTSPFATYRMTNYRPSTEGSRFDIMVGSEIHGVESKLLGEYMADNLTACFALADHIGIKPSKITEAIANFPGLKRRLEKRFNGDLLIFDDIAHSPEKAKSVLQSLKKIYSDKKLIAIFEPNTGNRSAAATDWYTDAFDAADEVIIPRLTKVKKSVSSDEQLFEGPELTEIIKRSHTKVVHIDDDEQLVAYLEKSPAGSIVVFLGSHGFRGMIESLVKKLQNTK